MVLLRVGQAALAARAARHTPSVPIARCCPFQPMAGRRLHRPCTTRVWRGLGSLRHEAEVGRHLPSRMVAAADQVRHGVHLGSAAARSCNRHQILHRHHRCNIYHHILPPHHHCAHHPQRSLLLLSAPLLACRQKLSDGSTRLGAQQPKGGVPPAASLHLASARLPRLLRSTHHLPRPGLGAGSRGVQWTPRLPYTLTTGPSSPCPLVSTRTIPLTGFSNSSTSTSGPFMSCSAMAASTLRSSLTATSRYLHRSSRPFSPRPT
mmetsp:Transcript_11404/g.31590  ORF Transcript_11404/g.31590 Transcript_11404/m.31590 type:complete len:263 (+) Transcript_11404:89-877(+)